MDNSLCNFTVIQNPNRRYANTVNIVFFRAYPLNKNFQLYIDGLKNWEGMMKKYYPESQLQIFVDRTIANDSAIQDIMKKMNARIFLFDCPEFKLNDTFHIGLFGTLVRFFPIFDINTLPMKIAHIQDLEPVISMDRICLIEKASRMKFKNKLSFLYMGNKLFEESPSKSYFEDIIAYPWILADRFIAFEKFPFTLLTNYLKDVESGKKFLNVYELDKVYSNRILKQHDKYSHGIDESFLNNVLIAWLITNHKNIGILVKYKISYPIYYSRHLVKKHKESKKIFDYILNKSQTVNESMQDFDSLFFQEKENNLRALECSDRFYEVIEKYPNWLGKDRSRIITKFFKGYLKRSCVFVISDNKIVEIKDVE